MAAVFGAALLTLALAWPVPAVHASTRCISHPAPAPDAALAAGQTIAQALAHAADHGAITEEERQADAEVYTHARSVRARLRGRPRTELAGAIALAEGIARRGLLTSTRLPAVFLTLQRNTEYWQRGVIPVAPQPAPSERPCAGKAGLGGARVTFAGDPVIFQWYPGQGLQLQPLATFGKANALAAACAAPAGAAPGTLPPGCHLDQLRATLDRMEQLAATRGGFQAWEYFFAFGGGAPPWISGLAQATGIQAFTHGAQVLGDPSYLAFARRALGAFQHPPPVGVRVRTSVGAHYLIYSFSPGYRVLNGFLQSLIGLFDFGHAANDPTALALFASGDREARREVPAFDTGAWSRYSAGGPESDLGYHELVRDFLQRLCDRTSARVYCATAARFTRYLSEPARLSLLGVSPLRVGRTAIVKLSLSKISCVTLRVRDAGGSVVRSLSLVLGRGTHTLGWAPSRAGGYTVSIGALDLKNHLTTAQRAVTVARRKRG